MIVIVEGMVKVVRRYDKFMMRRIDWNVKLNDDNDEMDVDDVKKNKCICVWRGILILYVLRCFCFEMF